MALPTVAEGIFCDSNIVFVTRFNLYVCSFRRLIENGITTALSS